MKKAGLYHKIAKIYDIIDYPSELMFYQHMRKHWIERLQNERILEIGVGTGKNFKYYNTTNKIVGIDNNIQMLNQSKRKLRGLKKN
ncbi:MAG: class I SAM-dependent methyltransferase [Candidatus Kariarchaeaceae archaeon]|jgi:demethylmenaquinone methyltransferase/2-methoxy-6-polyprenyl-1,4-benzoquinol methylase